MDDSINKIQARKAELISGLAELYMQKEDIEKTIQIQTAAIKECSYLESIIAGQSNEGGNESV